DLIYSGAASVQNNTITAVSGESAKVDSIIFATGFRADEFLYPMEIRGRNGVTLENYWGGDARAYATTTVPGFRNLFMILCPNTGLAANGSIVFMSECAFEYVGSGLEAMVERGARTMEPTVEAYDRFSETIDEENRRRAWGVPGASTWYQNKFGRVSQNWPGDLSRYWTLTHDLEPDDFVFD